MGGALIVTEVSDWLAKPMKMPLSCQWCTEDRFQAPNNQHWPTVGHFLLTGGVKSGWQIVQSDSLYTEYEVYKIEILVEITFTLKNSII